MTNPVYIYGDNKSVVLCNTTAPDSLLKKKSNSVAYHHCQEGVALDEWRTCYRNTDENVSDVMTKPLPAGEKHDQFCKCLFYFWEDHKNAKPDWDDAREEQISDCVGFRIVSSRVDQRSRGCCGAFWLLDSTDQITTPTG